MQPRAPDLSWGGQYNDPTTSARGKSQGAGQLQTYFVSTGVFSPSHTPGLGTGRGLLTFSGLPPCPFRVSRSSLCRPRDRFPRIETRSRGSCGGTDPSLLRSQPPETLSPAEAGGGGTSGWALLGGGGDVAPALHCHWSRAPDWRVYVTGRAHPLGNVFRLLHS